MKEKSSLPSSSDKCVSSRGNRNHVECALRPLIRLDWRLTRKWPQRCPFPSWGKGGEMGASNCCG